MKLTPWLLGSLTTVALAACGGNKGNNDTGAARTSGTESGTMQGSSATTADTGMAAMDTAGGGMSGMRSDTATGGARMHSDTGSATSGTRMRSSRGTTPSSSAGTTSTSGSDSAKGNQTKSGVTNTKTGKSTLGKGVTKTRPDQGEPVTSKGDTVSSGPDSNATNR
jgi:hypothetical protein